MVIRVTQQGAQETAATLNRVDEAQRRIQSSGQRMNQVIQASGVQSRQANVALINMSRVVQDLPYGFIGVANNIDPLILSFRALQAEAAASGSKVSAFGLLMRTIASPGGAITLGVSAITALILLGPKLKEFFSDSGESAEEAEQKIAGYSKAVKEMIDGIGGERSEQEISDAEKRLKEYSDEAERLRKIVEGGRFQVIDGKARVITEDVRDSYKVLLVAAEAGAKAENERLKQLREQLHTIKQSEVVDRRRKNSAEEQAKLAREMSEEYEKIIRAQAESDIESIMSAAGEFPDVPVPGETTGIIGRLMERQKELELEIESAVTEEQIAEAVEEQKRIRERISELTGKQVDDDQKILRSIHSSVSAVSALRSGMQGLGIETGSWLDKLISAVQTLVSIFELVSAIKAITGGIFSLGGLLGGSSVPDIPIDTNIPDVPVPTKAGGPSLNVYVMDAKTFDDFLRQPENRRRLSANIDDIFRKGR